MREVMGGDGPLGHEVDAPFVELTPGPREAGSPSGTIDVGGGLGAGARGVDVGPT